MGNKTHQNRLKKSSVFPALAFCPSLIKSASQDVPLSHLAVLIPHQPPESEEYFLLLEGCVLHSGSARLRGMLKAAKNPQPGGLTTETAVFNANTV